MTSNYKVVGLIFGGYDVVVRQQLKPYDNIMITLWRGLFNLNK